MTDGSVLHVDESMPFIAEGGRQAAEACGRGGATFNQYHAPTDKSRKPLYFVLDRQFWHSGFAGNPCKWRHTGDMMSRGNAVILFSVDYGTTSIRAFFT